MQGWFKESSTEELKLGESFEDGEARENYLTCLTIARNIENKVRRREGRDELKDILRGQMVN